MNLTFEEIEHLISSGESDSLELKETTGQLSRGMESGCAFMNSSKGGYLIFGVSDKGHINGQEVSDKTKREIANALKKFEPASFADVQYIPVPNSNKG